MMMNDAGPASQRLSPGEAALWLLQQVAPGQGIANLGMRIQLPAPVRWWPLHETMSWIMARHTALRSCFPAWEGLPTRVVRPLEEIDFAIDVLDAGPDDLDEALREYAARPFDLGRAPLLRLGLSQGESRPPVLCLVLHHLICDGAGLGVLFSEIEQGYAAFSRT
ncbi:hypothetical protein FAF44_28965, partial [Nonomuraea sp. MG754425]|uniref:condensation domain-containing protein n=1 Tax=Nonomuraea sp. MG754425 TaxID=2570319 RepID=UPI001F1ECECC